MPEGSGSRLITSRGGAVHSVWRPGSYAFKARAHFVAVMLAPSPAIRASLGGDRLHEYNADAGTTMIIPANIGGKVSWSSTMESVFVALTPDGLLELAKREFGTGLAELRPPPFGRVDPQALQLAQLLKVELTQRETPNEFYVDALVTMVGVHILRNYAAAGKLPRRPKGGLSNRSARRVQEFLDVNFSSKISVAELAEVASLHRATSSWRSRGPSVSRRTNICCGCVSIPLKNFSSKAICR